jgi:hypothetical protein
VVAVPANVLSTQGMGRVGSIPEWRRNSRCRPRASGGSATVCLRGWSPFRPAKRSGSRTMAR